MGTKKIIGLIILIIGIIMIFYAGYQHSRIAQARGENDQTSGMFQGNAASEAAGGVYHGIVEGKISQYDRPVMILMCSGIIVAIVGGALLIFGHSHKKRRR